MGRRQASHPDAVVPVPTGEQFCIHAFEERHEDAPARAEDLAEFGGGGFAVLIEVGEDGLLGGIKGGAEDDGLVPEGDDPLAPNEEREGPAVGIVASKFGPARGVERRPAQGRLDGGGGFADVVRKAW